MTQLHVSTFQAPLVSNAPWIDALIGGGRIANWNWLVPARNTIQYAFNVPAGSAASLGLPSSGGGVFNETQRAAAREILAYAGSVTGISFTETNSSDADLHFGTLNITDARIAGQAVWQLIYSPDAAGTVIESRLKQYVFLDNVEHAATTNAPVAGNHGYEVLLHEIGHTLGLKHPFEHFPTLPPDRENTSQTVMSYTEVGGPYSTFRELDLAALAYLYGFDGVSGTWGVGGTGDFYLGTSANESFTSREGVFAWSGLGGHDTLSLTAPLQSSSFSIGPGNIVVAQNGSTNYVGSDVETLVFPDNTIGYFELLRGLNVSLHTRFGTSGPDALSGSAGNDVLFGRAADDSLDGASGIDAAVYQGLRDGYLISESGTPGALRADVVDLTPGRDGRDTLTSVERLKFMDFSVALDLDGAAGMTAKLLGALFGPQFVQNRAFAGVGLQLFDAGMSYSEVAARAVADPLFVQLAGSASNSAFVSHVYRNVTGQLPSQSELDFYVNLLESGAHTRGTLGVLAAEAPANQESIDLVGLQQLGLEYG